MTKEHCSTRINITSYEMRDNSVLQRNSEDCFPFVVSPILKQLCLDIDCLDDDGDDYDDNDDEINLKNVPIRPKNFMCVMRGYFV